jgi:hypothetical protein
MRGGPRLVLASSDRGAAGRRAQRNARRNRLPVCVPSATRASSGAGPMQAPVGPPIVWGPFGQDEPYGRGQGGRKGLIHEFRESRADSGGPSTACPRRDAERHGRRAVDLLSAPDYPGRDGGNPGAGKDQLQGVLDTTKRPEELRSLSVPRLTLCKHLMSRPGSRPECKHLVSYRWPMQAPTGSRVVRSPSGQDLMYGPASRPR